MALNAQSFFSEVTKTHRRLVELGANSELELGTPLTQLDFVSEEEYLGQKFKCKDFKIEKNLTSIYKIHSNLNWKWQFNTKDSTTLFGIIRLFPISSLYEMDDELGSKNPIFERWRKFIYCGSTSSITIKFNKKNNEIELGWDAGGERSEILPLALGINDFLDLMLASCGVSNWQSHFTKEALQSENDDDAEFIYNLRLLEPASHPSIIENALTRLKSK